MFGISFTLIPLNQAGALVHVYSDGSIHLNHGGTEMGQGLFTKVAQIVAEEFGVPLHFVRITATNTAKVPNASPTAASSGTDLNGMAAQIAAAEIKGRMAAFAAEHWGVPVRDGRVPRRPRRLRQPRDGVRRTRQGLPPGAGAALPRRAITRRRRSTGTAPRRRAGRSIYFAYGAACAEVAIDTLTGEMRVLRADLLHDVGHSINPALDIGQVEGGFIQGMGWLTTEELIYDAKGRLTTHAPATYKIPVASDVPPVFNTKLHTRPQRDAERLSLEGGRRAAPDARDLGLFGGARRGPCDEPGRTAAARGALHARIDPQRHSLAERGALRPDDAGLPPPSRSDRGRRRRRRW